MQSNSRGTFHSSVIVLFFLGVAVILCSCRHDPQRECVPRSGNKYATGFMLDDTLGMRRLQVYAPWQPDSVMATYLLPQPLRQLALSSATHVGMLLELEAEDHIAGICNPELIYNPLPEQCTDLGDAMQPDIERIIRSGAEAIMYSTYAPSDLSATRMTAAGITVIYNNEWREQHPLARAEWIRFVGALVGKEQLADSIFSSVEQDYLSRRDSVRNAGSTKRTVVSGLDFRGTWYVPAGNTYMGVLFKDAGADYALSDNLSDSSVPLTFEQALTLFSEADVWLGCNVPSRDKLVETNSQYALFKAYQTGELYNFRKRCMPNGANDFWESGVVHPERILSDIINALNGDTTSFYYINPVR